VAEPRNYQEILENRYVLGRDFRVEFGDSKIDRCLLIAPHGGGIEPGSSEILRAVAALGGWAWYEFAGFLRQGNKDALHIASTHFDEPTLMGLLPQTTFVVAFHGASESTEPVVFVGGRWERGRAAVIEAINASAKQHGIRAADVTGRAVSDLRGLEKSNLTNRGKLGEGVQLEFSRGARNLLFPANASREQRGRRSKQLKPLASSIHVAIEQLVPIAMEQLRQGS
jgi:phage replication-related protein YjqB (UPF0714/DUF867 family)